MKKTIKDAVIALNGLIKNADNPDIYDYVLGGDRLFSNSKDDLVYLCSQQEFEACAKRMGYINGYLWGKEYLTNLELPDLPRGVLIEAVMDGDGESFNNSVTLRAGNSYWFLISKFKITDPRYKPVDELSANASTQAQSLTHSEEGLTHKRDLQYVSEILESKCDAEAVSENPECKSKTEGVSDWFEKNAPTVYGDKNNSWHESGDLPPAGVECEMLHESGWIKCKPIGFDGEGLVCKLYVPEGKGINIKFMPCYGCKFRPIRTEREKFIDDAVTIIPVSVNIDAQKAIAGALFDAGFRGPKVDK